MRQDIEKYIIDFATIPYERISIERVLTGFKDLDYYNKGIEVGITELIGDTNTGKSILTSRLIDSSISQGYKCGVFAGEHTLRKYKMLVMQQNAKQGDFELVPFIDNNGNETNIADWYVTKECEQRVNQKYNGKLYLYDVRKNERDIGTICDFMEHAYKTYGIRFFIIDNLMEIENKSENQFQEQTQIVTKLRNLSLRYNLFVVLVMHTNKAAGAEGFRMNVKNAFGSSNITNKGYNVWFLYRKDQIVTFNKNEKVLDKFKQDCAKAGFDFDACDGFIETAKTKGNSNGVVGITYDKDSKTFKQANKISQTDADKIYRKYEKKSLQQVQTDWDSTNNVAMEEIEYEGIDDIFSSGNDVGNGLPF